MKYVSTLFTGTFTGTNSTVVFTCEQGPAGRNVRTYAPEIKIYYDFQQVSSKSKFKKNIIPLIILSAKREFTSRVSWTKIFKLF